MFCWPFTASMKAKVRLRSSPTNITEAEREGFPFIGLDHAITYASMYCVVPLTSTSSMIHTSREKGDGDED